MSVERAKRKIQQLERKRSKLVLRATRLAAEKERLLKRSQTLELLVQHQHNTARVLHEYIYGSSGSSFPTLEEDTGLEQVTSCQWPLMQHFNNMQLAKYAWVHNTHITTAQVCRAFVHLLQQIALLHNYHTNKPDDAQPLLDAAVAEFLHLAKAVYLLNPGLGWGLKDLNLITLRHEHPPDEHWQRAYLAAEHTLEQLQQLQDVMRYVVPQMEQLEAERQQLMDMIGNMKDLSLHQQTVLQEAVQKEQQQQQQQQLQQQAENPPEQLPPAATRASNRRAHDTAAPNKSSHVPRQTPTATAAAAATTTGACTTQPCSATTTVALQGHASELNSAAAANLTAAAAAAMPTPGSSGSSGSGNWQSPRYPKLYNDMVNELDSKLSKWRTLSCARSASAYVSTSAQLAALFLHSFPYPPMASCLGDYIEFAMERKLQQSSQQPQLQQQQQQQQQQSEQEVGQLQLQQQSGQEEGQQQLQQQSEQEEGQQQW